jgi:hypothetical protein
MESSEPIRASSKGNYAIVSASKRAASAAIAVLGMTMGIASTARNIRQNAPKYFRKSLVLSF